MESSDGEQSRGAEKMPETEDISYVQELVREVRKIESYADELDQDYNESPAEEEKVLAHLTVMHAHKVLMNCLLENMKKYLQLWLTNEDHYGEAISEPTSPVLPPLPLFEISQVQGQSRTEGSSSDSDATSSVCSEMEDLEDLCNFDGPYWEALSAPMKLLATDEEENAMIMEASVILGSELNALNIIAMFDEAASGQQVGTSREVLLNIPLVYFCNSRKCSICRRGFQLKDRCARLPCLHHFHVCCILEWLLKKTTCPMCRRELPSR